MPTSQSVPGFTPEAGEALTYGRHSHGQPAALPDLASLHCCDVGLHLSVHSLPKLLHDCHAGTVCCWRWCPFGAAVQPAVQLASEQLAATTFPMGQPEDAHVPAQLKFQSRMYQRDSQMQTATVCSPSGPRLLRFTLQRSSSLHTSILGSAGRTVV